jgi:hypothetical protein
MCQNHLAFAARQLALHTTYRRVSVSAFGLDNLEEAVSVDNFTQPGMYL